MEPMLSVSQRSSYQGTHGKPSFFVPCLSTDDIRSIWANSVIENDTFMNEYFKNSLEKESAEMERIKRAVREAGVFIVLGYSERFKGSLYIAQVSRKTTLSPYTWTLTTVNFKSPSLTPPAPSFIIVERSSQRMWSELIGAMVRLTPSRPLSLPCLVTSAA